MGILRKMRRSEQKATVTDIIRTVQLADQLVSLNLLRLDLENFAAHFYPEVWDGKDDVFIRNWCKNIAQAIFVKTGKNYDPNKVLKLYSLAMADRLVGTFTVNSGLVRVAIEGATYAEVLKRAGIDDPLTESVFGGRNELK